MTHQNIHAGSGYSTCYMVLVCGWLAYLVSVLLVLAMNPPTDRPLRDES